MKPSASQQPGCTWQDLLCLKSHFSDMVPNAQVQHAKLGRKIWSVPHHRTRVALIAGVSHQPLFSGPFLMCHKPAVSYRELLWVATPESGEPTSQPEA